MSLLLDREYIKFRNSVMDYAVCNFGHNSQLIDNIMVGAKILWDAHKPNISPQEAVVYFLEISKYNKGENEFIISTLRGELEDKKKAPYTSGDDRLYNSMLTLGL